MIQPQHHLLTDTHKARKIIDRNRRNATAAAAASAMNKSRSSGGRGAAPQPAPARPSSPDRSTSVSSYLQRQQKADSDSLLRVQVESSSSSSSFSGKAHQPHQQRTTFYVPVSLMLQREMEMQQAAQKSNIDHQRWSGSRLYVQWKQQLSMNGRKTGRVVDEYNHHGAEEEEEEITLHLTPESSMEEFSTLTWKPWLTTCIRAYYNTGTIRIPDDCLGPDILLALEYFGILTTSPETFVFDSHDAYDRIRIWSSYFTHRTQIAEWIIHDYNQRRLISSPDNSDNKEEYVWVACVDIEETKQNQTYIQVLQGGGGRAGALWAGGDDNDETDADDGRSQSLSCRSVYELFCDSSLYSNESDAVSDVTRQMPHAMRKDFREHLMRTLHIQTITASFEMERVKLTTSAGRSVTEMRPTLRIQSTSIRGGKGNYAAAAHSQQTSTSMDQPQSSSMVISKSRRDRSQQQPQPQPQPGVVKMSHSLTTKESTGSDLANMIGLQGNDSEIFGAPSQEVSISKVRLAGERIIPSFSSTSYDNIRVDGSIGSGVRRGGGQRQQDRSSSKHRRRPSMEPIEQLNHRRHRNSSDQDVVEGVMGHAKTNRKLTYSMEEQAEQRHPLRSSPEPDDKRSSPEPRNNKNTITGRLKGWEKDKTSDAEFLEQIDATAPVKMINTAFGDLGSVTSGITMPFGDESSTVGELPRLSPNIQPPPMDDSLVLKAADEEKSYTDDDGAPIKRAMEVIQEEDENVRSPSRVTERSPSKAKGRSSPKMKVYNGPKTQDYPQQMQCDTWDMFLARVCDAAFPVLETNDIRSSSPTRSVCIPTTGSVTRSQSTTQVTDEDSFPPKPVKGATLKHGSSENSRAGVYNPTDEEDGSTSLTCQSKDSIVMTSAKVVKRGLSKQFDEFVKLAMDAIEPQDSTVNTKSSQTAPSARKPSAAASIPDKLPMPPQQSKNDYNMAPNTQNNHRGRAAVKRDGGVGDSNVHTSHRGKASVKVGGVVWNIPRDLPNPGSNGRDSGTKVSASSSKSSALNRERRASSFVQPMNQNDELLPPREPRRVRSKQNFAVAQKRQSAQVQSVPTNRHATAHSTASPAQVRSSILDNRSNLGRRAHVRNDGLASVPSAATSATTSAVSSNSKGKNKLFSFRRKSSKGVVRV